MRSLPLLLLLALLPIAAAAQGVPADSAGVRVDSSAVALTDTTQARADTVRVGATGVPVAPPAEGGPEEIVTYTASDSLIVVLADRDSVAADEMPDDRVSLYGDVEAHYGEAVLNAGRIEILLGREEARARPLAVSDTGAVGLPRFTDGTEGFSGREIVYNFGTRRGRVVGARTEIEGGFLLGGVIKQVTPDIVYASDAGYTTCSLDHPHYQLVAHRLMVEGDYVYSGPVQLRILGIPTPLWLPFGFFPAREGRRSGPLPPGYGDDPSFGLFLENLGYYWAASDYIDLLGKVKLGTRGSVQFDGRMNYVRRYRYDGALDVSLARLRRGERDDPDFTLSDNLRLRWSHQQTFTPQMRLSAAVDLSSNAQRVLSNQYDDRVAQTTTSTVSFSQNWPRGGRQLGLDLRATQQLSSGGIDATFPSLSFSQQRRFPLRFGNTASEGERWYEKIGVSYSGSLTNTYRFSPDPDSVLAPEFQGTGWIEALFDY
ncbi:MAG TPA: putative LPS assembly protein LptD, partial [Rhodothermales bacterium]|nr:putative LPS assembly protein LptD [Rhodothermales bacterium]